MFRHNLYSRFPNAMTAPPLVVCVVWSHVSLIIRIIAMYTCIDRTVYYVCVVHRQILHVSHVLFNNVFYLLDTLYIVCYIDHIIVLTILMLSCIVL